MLEILEQFKSAKILVVGDVMLDRYSWGTVTRISPEAPVPIVNLERSTTVPGGAANVAVNVANLGAKCSIAGIIGSDADGAILRQLLLDTGVDTLSLIECAGRPTAVKTRVIAHNQQVVRIDHEDTSAPVGIEKAVDVLGLRAAEFDLVILSDYAKGFLTHEVLGTFLSATLGARTPVLVDPKGRDFLKYGGAFMITPNRSEALEACKLDHAHPDAVNTAGNRLLNETEIDHILITEGENGMTLFRKNAAPVHIEAAHHDVFDVTGAGDCVIACLGVAIASGIDPVSACQIANIAAGISVRKIGTNPVTLAELTRNLEQDTEELPSE